MTSARPLISLLLRRTTRLPRRDATDKHRGCCRHAMSAGSHSSLSAACSLDAHASACFLCRDDSLLVCKSRRVGPKREPLHHSSSDSEQLIHACTRMQRGGNADNTVVGFHLSCTNVCMCVLSAYSMGAIVVRHTERARPGVQLEAIQAEAHGASLVRHTRCTDALHPAPFDHDHDHTQELVNDACEI